MAMRTCLILIGFFFAACSSVHTNTPILNNAADSVAIQYAKGFRIYKHDGWSELQVINPWQGAKDVSFKYILVRRGDPVPAATGGIVIETPVKRVVCLSTTHIAMIDFLNETETVVGISGTYLVSNKTILDKIDRKKVFDVGYNNNLNYELIMGLKPDVIFAYGIDNEFAGYVRKLRELGLKVVFNAEYLEYDPLAKTEWIKFMSAFYEKLDTATAAFDTIAGRYNDLKSRLAGVTFRPRILYGLPWNGTWYMAGGKSYAATLIADAGGDYLWKNNTSHEALPLSIESVYNAADSADYWINAGAAMSMADILAVEKRLANLNVFRQKRVYNNIAILTPQGGNDYWESGVMKPDIILKDMASILHPELFPERNLYYFRLLK